MCVSALKIPIVNMTICPVGGKLDSNPDSDHLSHVGCDPDSNPEPGARVNAPIKSIRR